MTSQISAVFYFIVVIWLLVGVCAYKFFDSWVSGLADNVSIFIQDKIGRSGLFLAKSLAVLAWLWLGINMFLVHNDSIGTATPFFAYGFWLCTSIVIGELALEYPLRILDNVIVLLKIFRWSTLITSIIVAGMRKDSYMNDSFAIMMVAIQLAVLYLAVPVKQRGAEILLRNHPRLII